MSTDKLPGRLRAVTERRMRQACHAGSALKAESELEQLAWEPTRTHPGAAASLRVGMAVTLTILRLGAPPTLARTLRSPNPIESMIEICRHSKNVKRWRDGTTPLRWCAAGMPRSAARSAASTATCTWLWLRTALEAHFIRKVSLVSQK